jgi:hypothetical protein
MPMVGSLHILLMDDCLFDDASQRLTELCLVTYLFGTSMYTPDPDDEQSHQDIEVIEKLEGKSTMRFL